MEVQVLSSAPKIPHATDFASQVAESGFAIVPNVLPTDEIVYLRAAVDRARHKGGDLDRGGIRNLLDRVPEARALSRSSPIRNIVEPILGQSAFAVRGILFDKTPQANWKVPWHQDLTIAVPDRIELAGFGPWTIKDGVNHVQPPVEVLERMLAVRIHLDECGELNGPLRVIPGSHRRGRLSVEQIQSLRQITTETSCPVSLGGAVLMRPLLLHTSSSAQIPTHRRVIHIDFASSPLPAGLRWLSEPA